jgi:reverse gyrase
VYDLIFRRFIASQMKPFKAVVSEYDVYVDGMRISNLRLIEDIVENGFNLIQPPKLAKIGLDNARVGVLSAQRVRGSRTALYSEGDVVLLMKKTGIGRPSTYAKIIESIKRHGYVVESAKRRRLVATKLGIEVYRHLASEFPDLISVETTRRMEETIDEIVNGEASSAVEIAKLVDSLSRLNLIQTTPSTSRGSALTNTL